MFQREEEASGQRQHAHPVQHERQEVQHRRGDQDQPITARVHQGSLRVRPLCARELRREREREGRLWRRSTDVRTLTPGG